MFAPKRIVTVAVMVYLLLALLFLLFPAVRSSVAGLGSAYTPIEQERDFFQVLAIIGAVLLALQLVIENLDSSLLRREVGKQDGKINELKAKLYDTHQQPVPTTPAAAEGHQPSISYPTAASAAAAAERAPHPINPPATPPAY